MSTESKLGRVEGLVLAGVALVALLFQLWLPSTHVAEADYQAVAQVLSNERQPKDVVLLVPWWTERARIFVPEGLPVVGYQGSDAAPLERFARIWVLEQPHQPRDGVGSFESVFLSGRTEVGAARDFGNLRLRLFNNGKFKPVVFDAAESLASAQVYLESPDGNRQPCQPMGSGFRCQNHTVTRELREVHYAPYTCLKLEAPGGPTRVVAEFTVPQAAESTVLQAGHIWEYGACRDCTPSMVTFELGGARQQLDLGPGDETMHRVEAGGLAAGSTVRIGLSSQNPNARVVCVTMTGHGRSP